MTSSTANGAYFVAQSANRKIGSLKKRARVSTTYASIKHSCPKSCPLQKTKECYAMQGHVALHMAKRVEPDRAIRTRTIARNEARLIREAFKGGRIPQDGARGGRDLRLHTAGDCRTNEAARILGNAANDWRDRDGGDVWTYTHAWREVERASWGDSVSVLASIDSIDEAQEARARGYAPAIYVPEHPEDGKAEFKSGLRVIPCPAQTRDVGCGDCRLCFDDARLLETNSMISFAAHGSKKEKMKLRLLT